MHEVLLGVAGSTGAASVRDAAVAFGVVAIAELGDKSMLLAVALATRYRPLAVLTGITTAAFTMLGIAAALGGALGAALPTRWLTLGGGLLFLVLGALTLRGAEEDEHEAGAEPVRSGSVVLGVALAFLVAEFGDKTMLATAALAASRSVLVTWVAAAAGMIAASGLAVGLAVLARRRVPDGLLRRVAGVLFLVVGGALVVEALRG
ncbi:MAG: hypothetical protein RLZZ272_172 [Actinomycetota bacterium]|jgi:putative Ca2+/H+ antiporter (TMEM165/GDT1 family)